MVPVAQQSMPLVPFPFMKLPLKLRTMVCRVHFSQHAPPEQMLSLCELDGIPLRGCTVRTSNGGVPVRQLWILSKDIYHEAMPLYLQTTECRLNSFETLGQFLRVIGPYHRQHMISVILNHCGLELSKDCETTCMTMRHTMA